MNSIWYGDQTNMFWQWQGALPSWRLTWTTIPGTWYSYWKWQSLGSMWVFGILCFEKNSCLNLLIQMWYHVWSTNQVIFVHLEVDCSAEEFCAVGCEIPLQESASAAYEFGRTALQASPQLMCMHLIKTNRLSVVQTRRCFAPKSLEKCIRQDGDGSAARLRWPIYSDCQVGMGQH
jgi:hypothetical protein